MDSTNNIRRIFVVLFGIGGIAAVAYSQFERPDAAKAVSASAAPEPQRQQQPEPEPEQSSRSEPVASPSEPQALAPAAVQRLVLDAVADDPGRRADAIDALAAAPEAAALPVLQKVLGGGDDIDRQLALSSLHVLALREGDTNGGIRELLRQAAYDGGDEAVASGAQAALDDIERSSERAAIESAASEQGTTGQNTPGQGAIQQNAALPNVPDTIR